MKLLVNLKKQLLDLHENGDAINIVIVILIYRKSSTLCRTVGDYEQVDKTSSVHRYLIGK